MKMSLNANFLKRILAAIIILVVISQNVCIADTAGQPLKNKLTDGISTNTPTSTVTENTYADMLNEYNSKGYTGAADESIQLPLNSAVSNQGVNIKYSNLAGSNALIWNNNEPYFEWNANVPKSGLYEIDMEYYPMAGKGNEIQRKLTIDGQSPFEEADNIVLYRNWVEAGKVTLDRLGNEVRPEIVEKPVWLKAGLSDGQGSQNYPFRFYLTKGEHSIRLSMLNEPMAISTITLNGATDLPTYSQISQEYQQKGYQNAPDAEVKFQAEDAVTRNDPSLRRETNGDLLCEPYSYQVTKLNVIGDVSWENGGSSITWDMTVPSDGLYKISMRTAQWFGDGLPSYREIDIDGSAPFAEMLDYKFKYNSDWYMETLHGSDNQPYLFYLTKGTHTLTMTVKLGDIENVLNAVTDDLTNISTVYREIKMLTGGDPDPNFNYEFYKNIPDLRSKMITIQNSLDTIISSINQISQKRPAMVNNFISTRALINDLLTNQNDIAKRLDELDNATIQLGEWLLTLQDQPLILDYFIVSSPDKVITMKKATFFAKVNAFFGTFIYSFFKDYNSIGVTGNVNKSTKVLNVWVGRGSEWVEILDQLIEQSFTKETGIVVKTNVIPAGQLSSGSVNPLMLSLVSGSAPDVALGVDASSPVEFAIRDAVVDLSKMPDYNTISKRFEPQIFTPFKYQNGVYALPETMGFMALFYRKDILAQIGLKVPTTWEQVYEDVIPKLYQNSMQFYYGSGLNLFMFQNGANFYNNNGQTSGLDSLQAYNAFKQWTELYTNYNVPVSSNFFNRFRSGEMPIGIGGVGDYIQFSTIAPELYGKWAIAPVPAQVNDDGTLNRTTTGIASTSAIILSQSKMKDESWKFLDWWTSDSVQIEYAREVEAIIGASARWTSANVNAFENLPWQQGDEQVIMNQITEAKEVPVVLGGYFTARHITNAFVRVVTMGVTPRDSLEQAVKDVNKELKAKQEEYGYFYNNKE